MEAGFLSHVGGDERLVKREVRDGPARRVDVHSCLLLQLEEEEECIAWAVLVSIVAARTARRLPTG